MIHTLVQVDESHSAYDEMTTGAAAAREAHNNIEEACSSLRDGTSCEISNLVSVDLLMCNVAQQNLLVSTSCWCKGLSLSNNFVSCVNTSRPKW